MAYGFDGSKWQDPALWDWAGIEQSVDLFIARASYGQATRDRHFATYAERVRAASKPLGAYHFYRQIHGWQEQLDVYVEQLAKVNYGPGDLYPTLDLEHNGQFGDGDPLKSKFNIDARLIAEALRAEFGKCILYLSSYFPEWLGARAGGTDVGDWKWILEDGYLHWLADHSRPPGQPRTPYTPWDLHQPKAAKTALYANGQVAVGHDYLRPGQALSELVIPTQPGPSDDATDGDSDTTDRPGGALPEEWEDAWAMLREGASLMAEGALLLERARDEDA